MLPRSKRLSSVSVKKLVFQGRVSRCDLGVLRYMVLSKETAARFGVSVSSSVVKKAVSRNKIRRKVYDAAGKLLPRFAAGAIAFLNVKRDISSVPADELVRSLEKTLSASGILLGNKTLEVADTPR